MDNYRPQTKFGARLCFYTGVSFCSQGRGQHRGVCIRGRGVCIQRGLLLGRSAYEDSASGGLHPGGLHLGRGLHPRGSAYRKGACIPHRILRDTVNDRVVRILLEWILVWSVSTVNFADNRKVKSQRTFC